jgi:sulfur carrier protein
MCDHGRHMQVTVNGAPREIPEGMTVERLVEHLGLHGGPVAIERNREVVPRAEHRRTVLAAGDVLEIVHFVGGG